ncbi:MAG TPA: hypothetical protein VNV37_12845 [Solirubrobacteraceae bacterium]|nr:hypothetical protein [Solirubrobacteraceae bacterium]
MPSEARIHGGADPERRSAGSRVVHAWVALERDRRLAAGAAVALFVTMLLPWYQQNAVVSAAKTAPLVSRNLNAFQVFTFIEAAILLVAVGVLFLLYMRAEAHAFRLPGGDGGVVMAAGLWSALLLILRLFDKPGITQHGVAANVGIQWGIFFALAAAGVLAYAGSRMRAGQRPEPPLLRRDRSTRSAERQPMRPPAQEPTVVVPRKTPVPARPRGRYPPTPGEEQLSFEDPPSR